MSAGFLLIHAKPNRPSTLALSWLLFIAGVAAYLWVAQARHRENPEDRVTPTLAQMAKGLWTAAMQPAEEDEQLDGQPAGLVQRFGRSMLW